MDREEGVARTELDSISHVKGPIQGNVIVLCSPDGSST